MPTSYEKIKARKESDPEYAARLKKYAETYREKNVEKERERQRLLKAKKREKDREAYNAYMREYNRKKVYPKQAEETRKRKEQNPEHKERLSTRSQMTQSEYWRHWKMKKTYGIGLFEYYEMYKSQNGKCAICESEKANHGKLGLVIDHCHKQGNVRKLLCVSCNTGLGQFKDRVDLLTKAIDYLTKHTKG